MRLNGVNDGFAFFVFTRNIDSDLNMRTFDFMVERLADIMQQAGAAGKSRVDAELAGHDAGKIGNLQRMVENVLTVAGAVTQPSEQLDKLRMNAVDARLDHGAFAFCLDGGIHLAASLFHHFLNAGGMNPSVGDQAFQCDAGHLAANRFKAGKRDRFRRVVNNQVNAGQCFQCADIPAFTTDDAALHFIVRQRNNGDGRLRNMIRGAALNRKRNNLTRTLVGFFFGLLLHVHDFDCFFVLQLVFQVFEQVILRLIRRKTRNALQHIKLTFLDGFGFGKAIVDLFGLCRNSILFFLQIFQLLIQSFLFLLNSAFLPLHLCTPFA